MRKLVAAVFLVLLLLGIGRVSEGGAHAGTGRRLTRPEMHVLKGQLRVEKRHRRGQPKLKWDSIAVRNASDAPREFSEEIFEVNGRAMISRRPQQSFTFTLAAQGSFRWERARFGKAYLVVVTDLASNQVVLRQTFVPIRGVEGPVLMVVGTGIDPRDQKIVDLQAQVISLQAQLATSQGQAAALQAQISSLLQQIEVILSGVGPQLSLQVGSNTAPTQTVAMGRIGVELVTMSQYVNNFDNLVQRRAVYTGRVVSGMDSYSGFHHFYLRLGASVVAGPVEMQMTGPGIGTITFDFVFPQTEPKGITSSFTLIGDATSLQAGGVSGSAWQFGIASNADLDVRSVANPIAPVTVVGAPLYGNTVTIAQTTLTVSVVRQFGFVSGRSPSAFDDMFELRLTVGTAGQATIKELPLLLQGGAVPSSATTVTASVVKTSGEAFGSVINPVTATWDAASSGWLVTFYPDYVLPAGSSVIIRIRLNSATFYDSQGPDSLSVLIPDVKWSDEGGGQYGLESRFLPLTGFAGSYE